MDGMMSRVIRFLEAPFPPGGVKWRLNDRFEKVKERGRGYFVPYVPVEMVLWRLNEALKEGVIEDWEASYALLPPLAKSGEGGGQGEVYVACTLRLRVGGEWAQRVDVGSGSDYKEAYSDALKRAARLFGVGSYVSHMQPQEVPVRGVHPADEGALRKEEERVVRLLFGTTPHPAPSAQPAPAQQAEQEDLRARLENAQKAIGELIDQLKAKNLGGQATKVLIKHRWMRDHTPPDPTPADLQRATAVYKELKALLQGGEAG